MNHWLVWRRKGGKSTSRLRLRTNWSLSLPAAMSGRMCVEGAGVGIWGDCWTVTMMHSLDAGQQVDQATSWKLALLCCVHEAGDGFVEGTFSSWSVGVVVALWPRRFTRRHPMTALIAVQVRITLHNPYKRRYLRLIPGIARVTTMNSDFFYSILTFVVSIWSVVSNLTKAPKSCKF